MLRYYFILGFKFLFLDCVFDECLRVGNPLLFTSGIKYINENI